MSDPALKNCYSFAALPLALKRAQEERMKKPLTAQRIRRIRWYHYAIGLVPHACLAAAMIALAVSVGLWIGGYWQP